MLGSQMGASEPLQWDVGEAAGLPGVPGAQNVMLSIAFAPGGAPLASFRNLP